MMGLVVRVDVREDVLSAGVGKWLTVWVVVNVGSRGVLTTLRSFFDIRVLGIHLSGPLVLGFHLNGP